MFFIIFVTALAVLTAMGLNMVLNYDEQYDEYDHDFKFDGRLNPYLVTEPLDLERRPTRWVELSRTLGEWFAVNSSHNCDCMYCHAKEGR